MFEVIKNDLNINFTRMYPVAYILSLTLVLGSLFFFFYKGLNYGVDFRGGAEIQIKFKTAIDLKDLRENLSKGGFQGASVQSIGEPSDNEFLVKVLADEKHLNTVTQQIALSLSKDFADKGAELRKTDIVGPKAGAELRASGFKAMAYSLIAILIYIGLRFDFKYAPGAVIALIHDSAIIIGVWAFTGVEFTLQIVAAVLTIIGYSVSDTVVIYDRVREQEAKHPGIPLMELLNTAINETLSRTILTAGATLLSSLAMFIWGGQSIRDFFLAVSIGIVVGTYSSVFVAAPITLWLDIVKSKGRKSKDKDDDNYKNKDRDKNKKKNNPSTVTA
ncbi:MAG: protein translocase subunit SecF [Oligoflexia bacterium]|nr:protein translocase subunit SecF [Oligoflexia bacterium]